MTDSPTQSKSQATDTVTVGVISRNGEPYLQLALQSFENLKILNRWNLEFIFVDSASTDRTATQMIDFATRFSGCRVFQLSGPVNAAIARNVILNEARQSYVFLVDGDVAVNHDFLAAGIQEIKSKNADAVYGCLPEIWYDTEFEAYDSFDDRYLVTGRKYVKCFNGVILLSPAVLASGIQFDTRFIRLEDIEFSTRVADQFRILTLPQTMGIHHTDSYYSKTRVSEYIRSQYQRPVGQLIRSNLLRPDRLIAIYDAYIGHVIGLGLVGIFILGLIFQQPLLLIGAVVIATLDICRFKHQERLNEYIPVRIIGGWHVLLGLFTPLRPMAKTNIKQLR